jgi:glycosyltransferase involved in cell wall biosynthesis
MKLSIVVPCYNEEKNIPLILEGFSKVINRADVEVVLVNNGSFDNTELVLNDLMHKFKFLKVIKVDKNQGYGYGILKGLKEASGEFIGWTHGDMQTPPQDVINGLEIIEESNIREDIYVKGRRLGRPLLDVIFTFGMSIFESLYLREKLFDINSQPNIFHRSFFEKWSNPPWDFSLDLYALYLAKKNKLKIIRLPVIFSKRIHGESHWNKNLFSKWKFIKRTLEYSFKLKRQLKNL